MWASQKGKRAALGETDSTERVWASQRERGERALKDGLGSCYGLGVVMVGQYHRLTVGRLIATTSGKEWGFPGIGHRLLLAFYGWPRNCLGTCGHVVRPLKCHSSP